MQFFSGRIFSNPKNWSFYRALIDILEDEDETLTASKNETQYVQTQCEKEARDFSKIWYTTIIENIQLNMF